MFRVTLACGSAVCELRVWLNLLPVDTILVTPSILKSSRSSVKEMFFLNKSIVKHLNNIIQYNHYKNPYRNSRGKTNVESGQKKEREEIADYASEWHWLPTECDLTVASCWPWWTRKSDSGE